MAKAIQLGLLDYNSSHEVDIFRVPEIKSHQSKQDKSVPVALTEILKLYDGYLFGIPSMFGNYPAEWKLFLDRTGELWECGDLSGKPAGIFVSSEGACAGQESTAVHALSVLVHHGMIFVPLGFKNCVQESKQAEQKVFGGSPWGSGTYTGEKGSRGVSEVELRTARLQGKTFAQAIRNF